MPLTPSEYGMPSDQIGQIPPEALMAMLAQAGGPTGAPPGDPSFQPAVSAPGGFPPQMQDPADQGGQGSSDVDILRQMLDLADQYRQAGQDEEDLLIVEQARTLIQKLLAKEQTQRDGLMSGKADPAALRRFAGSTAYG